jgi:DNA-binding PadR family transcriptional regulator
MRRGGLKFALLKLLAEREWHGYDVLREFRERGWGSPGPGSIYPILAMLEEAGYVRSRSEGDRRVYEITDRGRAFLGDHAEKVEAILRDMAEQRTSSDEEDDGRVELRDAVRRFVRAASQVASSSRPETVTKVRAIADRARKEIYALLAEE